MEKMAKAQFLDLVDLSIACIGVKDLYRKGEVCLFTTLGYLGASVDEAIAVYVYWAHEMTREGTYSKSKRYMSRAEQVLSAWVVDHE